MTTSEEQLKLRKAYETIIAKAKLDTTNGKQKQITALDKATNIQELDDIALQLIEAYMDNEGKDYAFGLTLKQNLFAAYENKYLTLTDPDFTKNIEEETNGSCFPYNRDMDIILPLLGKMSQEAHKAYQTENFIHYWAQYGDIEDFMTSMDFATAHHIDINYALYETLIFDNDKFSGDKEDNSFPTKYKKLDLLLNHYQKDFRSAPHQVWASEGHDPLYYYVDYKNLVSRLLTYLIDYSGSEESEEYQTYQTHRQSCIELFWPHLTEKEIENLVYNLIPNNDELNPDYNEPLLDSGMVDFVQAFYERKKLQSNVDTQPVAPSVKKSSKI